MATLKAPPSRGLEACQSWENVNISQRDKRVAVTSRSQAARPPPPWRTVRKKVMDSDDSKGRVQLLYAGIAFYAVAALLLVVPVLAVAFRWPELLWAALGPYLVVILGGAALFSYLSYRWGLLELKGPAVGGVGRFLGAAGVLTARFISVVIAVPGLVWVGFATYLVGIGYAVYRLVKGQSANLALQCQECGSVSEANLRTWLLSANMGGRKRATRPQRGNRTWARIVPRSDAEFSAG